MNLLNPILLVGLAAMAIPVIIHLFHRSHYRTVRWGATHLLRGIVSRRSRRFDLEQLILVVLRMAVLGILAFLMARPVITALAGFAGLPGQRPAVAVVLDVSYSMERAARFDRAREAALGVLRRLGEGAVATVVLAAETPVVLAPELADHGTLEAALADAKPIHGRARLAAAIRAASEILASAETSIREIHVFSDLQRLTWSPDEVKALREVARDLGAAGGAPALTLVAVGAGGRGSTANVSVDGLRLPERPLGVGEPVPVRARVTRRGGRERASARMTLLVDGEERGARQVELEPGSSREVLLHHSFTRPGSHRLEIRLEGLEDDAVTADGRYLFSVPVGEGVSVLIVDGEPDAVPLRAESGYLSLALVPYDPASVESPGPLRIDLRNGERLDESLSLAQYSVVVLANVRVLPERFAAALEGFARRGGGVLVFPGDRLDPAFYNDHLFRGGAGLLPAEILPEPGIVVASHGAAAIRVEAEDHPALAAAMVSTEDLDAVRVEHWLKLRPGDEGSSTAVPARLSTGDPFLVEKRHGQGRVILCATACDDEWSNLPLRSFYLPLMQELVLYLASGNRQPRNLRPGETLTLPLPADRSGKEFTLRLPGGREVEGNAIPRGEGAAFEYRDTVRPGFYTVFSTGDSPVHFAVNAERDESDLTDIAPGALGKIAREIGADVALGVDDLARQVEWRHRGVEIWRALLALVVALAFLEMVLQQRFERGSGR